MTAHLRIIFMGTPDFAVPALRALHDDGHQIVAVYCQPPKKSGRGQKINKTPVHITADELSIPVCTPKSLRTQEAQDELASFKADMIIVAAYGLILPQEVLDMPQYGCINIHGSLLPRWRGAAPIHRALLAGDTETGITIMQMDAGLDTGDMLKKGSIAITHETTAQSLHDAMADLGAGLIIESVPEIVDGSIQAIKQPDEGVTYAEKLSREEGLIDWNNSATDIERQIRSLTPWPGTYFQFGKEKIKVHEAKLIQNQSGEAGTLINQDFTVACGDGALRLTKIQRAGKKPTDGASVLRGMRLSNGIKFS